jgi:predicted ribosome-associated RNA-binding protein Tma20
LPDKTISIAAHYAQLIASSDAPTVTEAYKKGREHLNSAVNRVLVHAGVAISPDIIVALVDGGAVRAVSEGYDVFAIVHNTLEEAINSLS